MENKIAKFESSKKEPKHMSCKRLRDQLSLEMGEDVEQTAAIIRELSSKFGYIFSLNSSNISGDVLANIKNMQTYSRIHSLVAAVW